MFTCQEWSKLAEDIKGLSDLVTLALVADPFGDFSLADLHQCFDVVVPFKEHFIIDFRSRTPVSSHHRYYARRSLNRLKVEVCKNPLEFLDEWVELYRYLVGRHHITGINAFSRTAFREQLCVPGLVMIRASLDHVPVGLHLWYVQQQVGYSHLMALNETGYQLSASYALYSYAIDYFESRVRWLDLGGAAGLSVAETDGLRQFKRGWTADSRTAVFCGVVLQAETYRMLTAQRPMTPGYFPGYRNRHTPSGFGADQSDSSSTASYLK